MSLTILSIAYPFASVGPDAVGGAEQILSHLDRVLTRSGHTSLVIAREDSIVEGIRISVPRIDGTIDAAKRTAAHEYLRRAIRQALGRWNVDVVHMHGIDFASDLPSAGVPVLATLHLPVDWYPAGALYPSRPQTWLNCVSRAQHANCRANPKLLPPIENGVDLDTFAHSFRKRDFALMLTRICPEKGIHLAIEAAKQADVPLLIAGDVFPYSEHRRYFAEAVAPRLNRRCRFIGPVGSTRKGRLLASARGVLVPSLVPETSSLVACEALSSGTPVVAFSRGALPDIVEHGRTGFLVRTVEEMAIALTEVNHLAPETCRAVARQRFSDRRMAARYLSVYRELAGQGGRQVMAGAA